MGCDVAVFTRFHSKATKQSEAIDGTTSLCTNPSKMPDTKTLGPAPPLQDLFELVCCVNLRRRDDRWSDFCDRLPRDWPFRQVTRFPAIDGNHCPPPDWWSEGKGAWGCFRSHLRIVEECLNCGISSVLIFEDDAIFDGDFSEQAIDFFRQLPEDWGMAYLGGQLLKTNLRPPERVSASAFRAYNVNRTHAYALRGEMIREVYQHYSRTDWYTKHHVDHHLGRLHETSQHPIYVPSRWLVGQSGDLSDISGNQSNSIYWEHADEAVDAKTVPFVAVLGPHRSPAGWVATVLQKLGVHFGQDSEDDNPLTGGEAPRLADILSQAFPFPQTQLQCDPGELDSLLSDWLGHLMWCANRGTTIAGAKHPLLAAVWNRLQSLCGSELKVISIDQPRGAAGDALWNLLDQQQLPQFSRPQIEQLQDWLLDHQQQATKAADSMSIDAQDLLETPERQIDRLIRFLGIEVSPEQRSEALQYAQQYIAYVKTRQSR